MSAWDANASYTAGMRWMAVVAIILVAIPFFTLGPRGSIVAIKAAMFVPEIFPDAPVRPLRWITEPSRVEHHRLSYEGGDALLDVYVPSHGGPHGAVVLMLGARPIGQDDPTVTAFADGLSRLGLVVLVPASEGLANGRITPAEVDLLVQEFQLLHQRADVDRSRVGFIGLSVGGSLTLMAAADSRIASDVRFVNAFGAYFSATDLYVALASQSLAYAGVAEGWEPAPLVREVLLTNLLERLPSEDERILVLKASDDPSRLTPSQRESLSEAARHAVRLFERPDHEEARRLIAPFQPSLEAISPSRVVSQIRANILVMHDVNDQYIPYPESRRLAAALAPGALRAHTELELFDHVMPGQSTDMLTFVRELMELTRHVYLTCLEML